MSIYDTYAEYLIEQVLRELLHEGIAPSVSNITQRFEEFTADHDINKPLFVANDQHVEEDTPSSASGWNETQTEIHRDLLILYRHLFKISDQAIVQFERWRNEAQLLEGRLSRLEDRIQTLLLISQDTAGYLNYFQDNFVSVANIDLEETTAYIDVAKGIACIGTSNIGATRHDLSALTNNDVVFTVLTRNNLSGIVAAGGSQRKYAIQDMHNYWQDKVYATRPGPMSIELKIDLKEILSISKVDIDLHMSNQNSTVQITPMYTATGSYDWKPLPVDTPTRSVLDRTIFQFEPVDMRYFKLIMTKTGHDSVQNGIYMYEFGADEISFYDEGFDDETSSNLISKAMSVARPDGSLEEFGKIVLEVCELVPDGTSIDYYVAVGSGESDLTNFVAIDPLNREASSKPTVLDFGDLSVITSSGVMISYDATATVSGLVSPGASYDLATSVTAGVLQISNETSSESRYALLNSNDRILDLEFGEDIEVATGTLEVWRNVALKNCDLEVRDRYTGWGYSDPYYETVGLVENAAGLEIDFGGQPVIIDGSRRTGKVNISYGPHRFQVHRDNWKNIDHTVVTDLPSLKAEDPLYPYNHRYLIAGLNYPTGWSTEDEQVYRGLDIVAEFLMSEVSIFDMLNNLPVDDYSRYALDLDAESPIGQVFVLKVDENHSDFTNERFTIRFKSANSLFKYLKFKAVLSTTDSTLTPMLDSYRIKVSS